MNFNKRVSSIPDMDRKSSKERVYKFSETALER